MNLWEALLIGLRALRANRLRSTLTMLGLIIGVSAVILLVACGQGVQNSVNARVGPYAKLVTVVTKSPSVPGGPPAQNLTDADSAALQNAPGIGIVVPAVTGTAPIQAGATTYLSASIIGSTDQWPAVNNRNVQAGSFFDATQAREAARVVVLGPDVADALFADPTAALDHTVQIDHQPFHVIGVMQSYGQQANNTAIIPLNTARRYAFGYINNLGEDVNQISVQATQQTAVPAAMTEITHILDARHHITDPQAADFQIQSLGSRLQSFNQIVTILTLFTPAVAGLSLIVGGIGVLNIMLVSVTERTREIGIRKALGATDLAILEQFIMEATVLAGLGGLLGVGFGVGLSLLIRTIAPAFSPSTGVLADFAPVLSVPPVIVAFGISLAIGLIAGSYPAYRAARLLPIQALRYQ